jgi:hypothetical protein
MYYSEQSLKELSADYAALDGRIKTLLELFVLHKFENARAREFATQGSPQNYGSLHRQRLQSASTRTN